jgi:hypothetical protein
VADVRGQATALTTLTAIKHGHEQRLREVLESFPPAGGSPLAKVGGTHFARWVIVPQLVYGHRPQKPDTLLSQYLLFTSTFDGPAEAYFAGMCGQMPSEIEAVWGNCVGYPGLSGFPDYLEQHRIRTGLFVAAYPTATLAEVRVALELRGRLIDLATRAHGLDDASLRSEFLKAVPV